MKGIVREIYLYITILVLSGVSIYLMWGPVPPIEPTPDPTNQELRDEIVRLAKYEAFLKSTKVDITYDGCEDMRVQLGLKP